MWARRLVPVGLSPPQRALSDFAPLRAVGRYGSITTLATAACSGNRVSACVAEVADCALQVPASLVRTAALDFSNVVLTPCALALAGYAGISAGQTVRPFALIPCSTSVADRRIPRVMAAATSQASVLDLGLVSFAYDLFQAITGDFARLSQLADVCFIQPNWHRQSDAIPLSDRQLLPS